MTDQQILLKIITNRHGDKVDNIQQLISITFTGEELLELCRSFRDESGSYCKWEDIIVIKEKDLQWAIRQLNNFRNNKVVEIPVQAPKGILPRIPPSPVFYMPPKLLFKQLRVDEWTMVVNAPVPFRKPLI
ncbi:MAG TPA: hypothetical protein VGK59_23785 [Ohtaekwangia sp.]